MARRYREAREDSSSQSIAKARQMEQFAATYTRDTSRQVGLVGLYSTDWETLFKTLKHGVFHINKQGQNLSYKL